MDRNDAIEIVRLYKDAIADVFSNAKVYLYGSYSKGGATKDSDIDVAVVVPQVDGDWLQYSSQLWFKTITTSTLIEPVLLEECHPSPLYEDVLRTGILI